MIAARTDGPMIGLLSTRLATVGAAERRRIVHLAEDAGCFVCGPEREPGDGLRVFPAAGPNCVVWPWIPEASHTGDDGLVRTVLMWAVLDCPSGMTWIHEHPDPSPHVLGRLTAEVRRRPAAGERVVVAGWTIGEEGRKRLTGSVVWAAGGEVVARALATWIALDERQRAIFRPAGETG